MRVSEEMVDLIDALKVFILVGLITCLGGIMGKSCERDRLRGAWVKQYSDKPYCETTTIQGKEFKRCWKVVEVKDGSTK